MKTFKYNPFEIRRRAAQAGADMQNAAARATAEVYTVDATAAKLIEATERIRVLQAEVDSNRNTISHLLECLEGDRTVRMAAEDTRDKLKLVALLCAIFILCSAPYLIKGLGSHCYW